MNKNKKGEERNTRHTQEPSHALRSNSRSPDALPRFGAVGHLGQFAGTPDYNERFLRVATRGCFNSSIGFKNYDYELEFVAVVQDVYDRFIAEDRPNSLETVASMMGIVP